MGYAGTEGMDVEAGSDMIEAERLLLRLWRGAGALACHANGPDIGPVAGCPLRTLTEDSQEIIRTVFVVMQPC